MASFDFTDLYSKFEGYPSYNDVDILEDEIVKVIVAKYEMILLTNKGDVLGDPNFGADLEFLLHQTKVSADFVKNDITEQVLTYIPEISGIDFTLDVKFITNGESYTEVLLISFEFNGLEVNLFFD